MASPAPVSRRVEEVWNAAMAPTGPSWPFSASFSVPAAVSHTLRGAAGGGVGRRVLGLGRRVCGLGV